MKFIASSICQGMRTDTVYHFLNLNFADKYTNSTIPQSSMEKGALQVAPPIGLPPEIEKGWALAGKVVLGVFHALYDDDEKDLAFDLLKPFAADWLYTTAGNIEVLGYTLPEAVERDYHLPLLTDGELLAFEETRDFETYGKLSACRIYTGNETLTMAEVAKMKIPEKSTAYAHPMRFVDGDWQIIGGYSDED